MKFIRDINKISKKERQIVGVLSTFVAIGFSFLIDGSMGVPPMKTMFNDLVAIGFALVFFPVMGYILKKKGVIIPQQKAQESQQPTTKEEEAQK